MAEHFTHLHLHSEYSLLDGAIPLDKLIAFGKEHNFKALAITDHGNIFGAVKFFSMAKKANIKPILGIESYFTQDTRIKNAQDKYYHLILLVQNAQGYKNLCKLISFAYQTGFYFKPRIDYQILEQYSEGLIATSACLGGHIPSLLMNDQDQEAQDRMDWFLRVFGPERFYFEVQPEDQHEQHVLNEKLFYYSTTKGIQTVATGDCHYVAPQDRNAHEVMLAIQTHHKMSDPDRFTFGQARVHIRTQSEMLELFKNHPEAVFQSGAIADKCNFQFETGKLFFPRFEIPQEYTQETYFKQLCVKGLQELIATGRTDATREADYWQRLENEIVLITKMGFIGYFLVVSDFIQWARKQGIPVGPGRGSAAGSLVAWSLQITDIDPLRYNLLFERFLNPERISMPDIDIDFCIEGREAVINYVRDKYGHDKVCQIITFGTMMAKGVIKDVARALGFPFEDSNALTDLIPDQLKITLKEALEQEPKLKELIANNTRVAQLFDLAFRLEGLTRHASKHAAGIVISPDAIDEVLPVYVPPKTTDLVTQYAMTELENLGFLKIDLLGLKNLTLIDRAVKLIQKNHNHLLNIAMLPLDDAKTFSLLEQGQTAGVFQLESDGLKDVLRRLQPDKFEDIIAVNALYRPGPLGSGMVDDYIERRHGRQKITYIFPELEAILQETYGVIVYQEQVIKIASSIGGYSLGEADILRRAMGKKKAEEMAAQRSLFLERAQARNFDAKKAGELFDLMAYFAGYGFNKSHSAAYALIAYQTAYLKAHYTAEFMACLISLEAADSTTMASYIQEAKDIGLPVMPPDINRSAIEFSVTEEKILFGLRGIKHVGMASLENILQERQKKPFVDLLEFCERIDLRTSNKRVIESLICAGTFDMLPGSRAQKHEELPKILDLAAEKKKATLTGQLGLFDIHEAQNSSTIIELYKYPPVPEWSDKVKLEKEKEVMGIYISAQPLDSYARQLGWLGIDTFAKSLEKLKLPGRQQELYITACGSLQNVKSIATKKGDKMAFVALEDNSGKAEVVVFPKLYAQIESWLSNYHIFVVRGALDEASTHQCKIKAQQLVPLDLLVEQGIGINRISLELPASFDEAYLAALKTDLVKGSIPLELIFSDQKRKVRLLSKESLAFDLNMIRTLESKNIKVTLCL